MAKRRALSYGCEGMDWFQRMSTSEQQEYLYGSSGNRQQQQEQPSNFSRSSGGKNNEHKAHEQLPAPQSKQNLSTIGSRSNTSRTVDSVEIEGSKQFQRQVKNALNQIKGTKFEPKVANLKKIREVATYGETSMGHDGVFDVAPHILGRGAWAASQIVHDAEHYDRMQNGTYLGIGRAEEKAAFKPQAEFLASKGSIFNAIAVSMMDGSHADDRISS